jgi:O-antigen/teichoic acid export membrane protein
VCSSDLFYGVQREHVTELLQTGQKAIFAVVALLLASIGFELAGVFAGYLLSFVVVTLVGILALRSRFRLRLPGVSKSRALVTDLFTYGGTQLIGGLAAMLLYKTDVLLVRYFRDATAAGVYNAAIVPAEESDLDWGSVGDGQTPGNAKNGTQDSDDDDGISGVIAEAEDVVAH